MGKPNSPKWASVDRKAKLVDLFLNSGGFCVFGHKGCLIPEHHYQLFIEGLIKDWQSYDREERQANWQAERIALHQLAEPKEPLRGRFSAISKDIWRAEQPLFYLESLGISGLTFKPFAKIRVSSSYMRLHVNLGDSLKPVSKARRRKAIRYGKPLPKSIEENINKLIGEAVRHYLYH
jgi:hypothetical protein